jgi:predicted nucleotidyltransferase
MKTSSLTDLKTLSHQLPEKIPYLKMLILFGSQARGDTHAKSDWDFAALYDEELRKAILGKNAFAWFEVPNILGKFFELNSDNIDVVELNRCSSLVAHFVARDGKLLYEKEPGQFEAFRQQALMKDNQLKQIQKTLREKIEANLQGWGV